VERALRSKWDGVKVTGTKTLASWGDETSLRLVREILVEVIRKEARWSAASAIAKTLAPHLSEEDLPWIFGTVLEASRHENAFVLWPLFERLDPRETAKAIEGKLSNAASLDTGVLKFALKRAQSRASEPPPNYRSKRP
jgi:hypothetical protein